MDRAQKCKLTGQNTEGFSHIYYIFCGSKNVGKLSGIKFNGRGSTLQSSVSGLRDADFIESGVQHMLLGVPG